MAELEFIQNILKNRSGTLILFITFLRNYIRKINDFPENIFSKFSDWKSFLNLCEYHRVNYAIYHELRKFQDGVPKKVTDELKKRIIKQSLNIISQIQEMKKISDLFNAGGIELYFIKGIALSALLYNNSEARSSRDIDIFINDNDMDIIKADKLLRNNGYFRFVPVCEADSMLFKIYRKNYKHFKYKCQESAHLLEMHWKLHNYDTLYPNIIKDISGNYILVNIDGINIKTLLPEDYVLYLSIHGARHNWGQLYWLLDLAVIIDNWKINWKDIYSKANRHNMLRSVSSGLILTNRLFGSSIPENFTNSYIKNNNATRLIVNNSLKVICSGYLGMGKIRHFYLSFKSFLFIKPGLRHKLNIFLSLLTSYHDWEVLPLPEKLFFLYYFLRPFLWFYRHYLKK